MVICTEKTVGDQDGSCSVKMKHVVPGVNDSADEETFKYGEGASLDLGVVRAEVAQGISKRGIYLLTLELYAGKSDERQERDLKRSQARVDEVTPLPTQAGTAKAGEKDREGEKP